jgi:hypothetical protein
MQEQTDTEQSKQLMHVSALAPKGSLLTVAVFIGGNKNIELIDTGSKK